MKPPILLLALLVPVAVGFQFGNEPGIEVKVHVDRNATITGELLAVRDSALVVCRTKGLDEYTLASRPQEVVIIPRQTILKVRTKFETHEGTGALMGGAVGCAMGCALGYASVPEPGCNAPAGAHERADSERERNTILGVVVGTLGGVALGGVIGSKIETEGIVFDAQNLSSLKPLARYPATEPAFLRGRTE
jgi:outer membrane lipoprotein SlyB